MKLLGIAITLSWFLVLTFLHSAVAAEGTSTLFLVCVCVYVFLCSPPVAGLQDSGKTFHKCDTPRGQHGIFIISLFMGFCSAQCDFKIQGEATIDTSKIAFCILLRLACLLLLLLQVGMAPESTVNNFKSPFLPKPNIQHSAIHGFTKKKK